MELSFSVNGREALPVRAVSWVVGAEAFTRKFLLPPSLIVQIVRTACDAKDTIPGSPLLRLYRYDKDRVLPVTSERLDATAPEYDFQEEADEPLRESTSRLPAGVFVFLDELRRCVDWLYPPGCYDGVCRDVVELNTSPDLPDEMIERLQEGFVAPRPNAASERSSPRKILFWLAPNEILIQADQVPGAIADTRYPRPFNSTGRSDAVFDPNKIPRLEEERRQSKLLRAKFPSLPDDYSFCIGDLNDYLARIGLVAEIQYRSDTSTMAHLGPESRWSERQFVDGFNSVSEPIDWAKQFHAEISDARCTELSSERELYIDHWIELVGLGLGQHESYRIEEGRITFRKWETDYISSAPKNMQKEMTNDNRTAPCLTFPCSPVELLNFVDSAIAIHCFSVPDAFRLAVTCEYAASSGTPQSDESTTLKATPAAITETPEERRAAHDMATERGCRELILRNWETIRSLHGDKPSRRNVLRILERNIGKFEEAPTLKTVSNTLSILRQDKLIP